MLASRQLKSKFNGKTYSTSSPRIAMNYVGGKFVKSSATDYIELKQPAYVKDRQDNSVLI